jgi:hypothetical protein
MTAQPTIVPTNELARQILLALESSEFEPRAGYFSSQSFCLAVPVGLPSDSFKLGKLLSFVSELEVSYDIFPNGRQFVVFPAALVRLG